MTTATRTRKLTAARRKLAEAYVLLDVVEQDLAALLSPTPDQHEERRTLVSTIGHVEAALAKLPA